MLHIDILKSPIAWIEITPDLKTLTICLESDTPNHSGFWKIHQDISYPNSPFTDHWMAYVTAMPQILMLSGFEEGEKSGVYYKEIKPPLYVNLQHTIEVPIIHLLKKDYLSQSQHDEIITYITQRVSDKSVIPHSKARLPSCGWLASENSWYRTTPLRSDREDFYSISFTGYNPIPYMQLSYNTNEASYIDYDYGLCLWILMALDDNHHKAIVAALKEITPMKEENDKYHNEDVTCSSYLNLRSYSIDIKRIHKNLHLLKHLVDKNMFPADAYEDIKTSMETLLASIPTRLTLAPEMSSNPRSSHNAAFFAVTATDDIKSKQESDHGIKPT